MSDENVSEEDKAEGTIEPEDLVVPEPGDVDYEATELSAVAREVNQGKWGVGQERRLKLAEAGFNANEVEKEAVRLLNS